MDQPRRDFLSTMNNFSINNVSTTNALLLFVPLFVSLHLFRTYWRLRHIPGPFLSRITNLPRVSWVKTKHAQLIHRHLHEQYGEVVRTGPNMVTHFLEGVFPTSNISAAFYSQDLSILGVNY